MSNDRRREKRWATPLGEIETKKGRVTFGPRIGVVMPAHRFPAPTLLTHILGKACLWCYRGDLVWDVECEEWACVSCGWREFEKGREERGWEVHETPNTLHHRRAGGYGGAFLD